MPPADLPTNGVYVDDCGIEDHDGYVVLRSRKGAIKVAGGLDCPMGVAVDAAGDIYFANTGDGEVKKISQ